MARTSEPQTPATTVLSGRLDRAVSTLDRRVHAYRPDLADIALASTVGAQHYVVPVTRTVRVGVAGLHAAPSHAAEQVSQLLCGEQVALLDESGGWSWVQGTHDGYVGFVPSAALAHGLPPATHRVIHPLVHVFSQPSIKSAPIDTLPMGASVSVPAVEGSFAELAAGGFVRTSGLATVDSLRETDWVAVASRFLETPYLWGGRTARGIDCSGLVQVALMACGRPCPRDADQQRAALGVPVAERADLRRGDLVYFPGHVGLMSDGDTLLHANAFAMRVTLEPLDAVIARVTTEQAAREKPAGWVWAGRRLD